MLLNTTLSHSSIQLFPHWISPNVSSFAGFSLVFLHWCLLLHAFTYFLPSTDNDLEGILQYSKLTGAVSPLPHQPWGETMQRCTTVTVSHRTVITQNAVCYCSLCWHLRHGHLYLVLDGPVACDSTIQSAVSFHTLQSLWQFHTAFSAGFRDLPIHLPSSPSQSDSFLLVFCNVAMSRHTVVSLQGKHFCHFQVETLYKKSVTNTQSQNFVSSEVLL